MADQLKIDKTRKNLKAEEKAALVLLSVISVLGVTFGFKSFSANLNRPFENQMAKYTGEKVLTLSQQEAAETELQKTIDTDSDGLVDYDELYVYKTSPYLADSDSDGFDDKTEIFSNNNPNCPEGKDCLNSTALASTEIQVGTEAPTSDPFVSQALNFNSIPLTDSSFQTPEDIQSFFSQMGATEIRSLLISQGVPKESVDAMTDEEIMALLQASLLEAETSGQFDEILQETQAATDVTTSDNTNGSSTNE
ncbi:MAG: hypothetical protein V1664_05210 [Candidatus Uhrbacteria bacterium]